MSRVNPTQKYCFPSGRHTGFGLVIACGLVFAGGCSSETPDPKKTTEEEKHNESGHATQGPHGGPLIELGKEEYHVELIHDDKAGEVTFYVLDGSAKKAVPIEAVELVVNLKHDGKGEQFKIAAKPDAGDGAGKSSRFFSNDKELAADLDADGADAELVVTITGKQYRGAIVHEHGNEGHAGHKD